jgi:phosphatidylserine/phosphatidylglycerophosphate/cardiolipin synthase-like enzyme
VGNTTARPLVDGNRIDPLDGGNEAYPLMLTAIDEAKRSIALASYIFDNDPTGRIFAEALGRAVARGVEVRVLIDGIGSSYTFPSITRALTSRGVKAARFLPTSVPFYFPYANLRNHRKIMVVDGQIGFTGGLNIRDGCWLAHEPRHPVRDTHFRLEGPVVAQLLERGAGPLAWPLRDRRDPHRQTAQPGLPHHLAQIRIHHRATLDQRQPRALHLLAVETISLAGSAAKTLDVHPRIVGLPLRQTQAGSVAICDKPARKPVLPSFYG